MLVSIHQPAYLPWLGYFDKIVRADTFIYLDTVQFQKNSFQNRNRIRTKDGTVWLTVPVETRGALYATPLGDVAINNRVPWRKKHLSGLRMNYGRAPYGDDMLAHVAPFYDREWARLSDLCFEMMQGFLDRLDIATPVVKASELGPNQNRKSDLVLSLCRQVGADTYLSGQLGRDYLDEASFGEAGIEIVYQHYETPAYAQAYPGFERNLAIVDALANVADPRGLLGKPAGRAAAETPGGR